MPIVYELPLAPVAQTFSTSVAGRGVRITLAWRNAGGSGWCMSLADENGTPLLSEVPLVTGCDLLGQHKHLGLLFEIWVQGDPDPAEVPTYAGLGTQAKLYAVVP